MEQLRTLTIVKTDIAQFTRRVEGMGSADLRALLKGHEAAVLGPVTRYGGTVVKAMGDSYLATFESSTHALLAAIGVQRAVSDVLASIPGGVGGEQGVDVRVAVTAGDVLVHEGDVFGTPVNLVARLEEVTPAGEIYFTEAVYQNLNRGEVACEFAGARVFAGIGEPVRVYRTTFRHQTRVVAAGGILFLDLIGFSGFATSAELAAVEDVLESWTGACRQAAAEFGGVVRVIAGDAVVMTFDRAAEAVGAWRALRGRTEQRGTAVAGAGGFALTLGAGLGAGEVRVFRSVVYGVGINHACALERCSRLMGGRPIVATAEAAAGLAGEALMPLGGEAEAEARRHPVAVEGLRAVGV